MRTAREIAYLSVMTALLLGGQFALSGISGVEIVTVLLLGFSYTFGAKRGMLVASAFSVLRCFLFGFFPYVLLLYFIYFNAFAFLFGMIGEKGTLPVWICPVLLLGMGGACLYFAVNGIPIDFMADDLKVMLWILFALFCLLLILFALFFVFGRRHGWGKELASVTVLAAFSTVCFTLLDDVLWPLWSGLRGEAAVFYFYNGFFAMIPQAICTVVSVGLLFYPLKKVFSAAAKRARNNGRNKKDMV